MPALIAVEYVKDRTNNRIPSFTGCVMEPRIETEQDLVQLVGQPESTRLEFKRSDLLLRNRGRKEKIAEVLSKEVSAFANAEGGQIIIGITERREGKTRVADALDEGIPAEDFGAEWLQQIVESNVSPYLPGIRVRRIRLTREREGRWAAVIVVPRGSTAYQASDKRYYGRSEYEAKALPDHEIRLRMMRGRLAQAQFVIADVEVVTAAQEVADRQRKVEALRQEGFEAWRSLARAKEEAEAPKRTFDQYLFKTSVRNVGEVTIRDFRLSVEFDTSFEVRHHTDRAPIVGKFEPGVVVTEVSDRFDKGTKPLWGMKGYSPGKPPDPKVFPGEEVLFPGERWEIRVPLDNELSTGKHFVRWTIYLDDAPPCFGNIDLGEELKSHSVNRGE